MSTVSDLLVFKFGGTSVADTSRLQRAAQRIRTQREGGKSVIAVVSAAGRSTDYLLDQVDSLSLPSGIGGREVDRILATGEDRSASLLALALLADGTPARSLRGGEAGIHADGEHGEGLISRVDAVVLEELLAQGVVPVVSGFQARNPAGETLTLGRGGSDITAVALAAALGASAVHIVTDVVAVYDSDPRLNPQARPFASMDHAQLVALTESGAQVIHPRAARLAAEHALALHVYHHEACPSGAGTVIDACAARAAGVWAVA